MRSPPTTPAGCARRSSGGKAAPRQDANPRVRMGLVINEHWGITTEFSADDFAPGERAMVDGIAQWQKRA